MLRRAGTIQSFRSRHAREQAVGVGALHVGAAGQGLDQIAGPGPGVGETRPDEGLQDRPGA
jgi:hypothetical protein